MPHLGLLKFSLTIADSATEWQLVHIASKHVCIPAKQPNLSREQCLQQIINERTQLVIKTSWIIWWGTW